MQPFVVAAASVNQTPLDWDGNEARLRAALVEARAHSAQLVCFPELCISGYGCEDAFNWPATAEQAFQVLESLLPETRGLIVALGLPLAFEGQVFNGVALVVNGEILGFAVKRHLAAEGLHYEPRWFRPWPKGTSRQLERGQHLYPLGDLVFEVGGVRLGFEICEDAWVSERPGYELKQAQVDLVLNPSASHFAFGKYARRRELIVEGARAFGAAYLYANLLGNEAGRAIYDGDTWLATSGEVQCAGRRFAFFPYTLALGVVDVDAERARRLNLNSAPLPFEGPLRPVVRCPFDFAPAPSLEPLGEQGELPKEEAFARAVALGLYDYARKTRSRGFVLSLSGGADSAAVAVLVRYLVRLGVLELGLRRFAESLGVTVEGDAARAYDELSLVTELLSTVYQSTDQSSEVTRHAAEEVARAVGARHSEWSVEELARGYRARAEVALERELSWESDDLALQNVQARARAPGVWMLANVRGALLLATSNRSEAAVGYATMDGDTAGGVSPLAGIDKWYLRTWLRYAETPGLAQLGPLEALSLVNAQAPTAELRPLERAQTDESDLMPYDVLDFLERATVVERKSPGLAFEALERTLGQYPSEQLLLWTERFYRLFARSQWKRERYAPGFHLDDASLDPKTWFRFPILSGGFERELRELRAAVAARNSGYLP